MQTGHILTQPNQITDTLGKMQYIPFPTCAETSRPLSLRYGISESVNCTIATVPDDLYHLLEYYVHSDVPMSCRVPTEPLSSAAGLARYRTEDEDKERKSDSQPGASTDVDVLDTTSGPAYTPLTFALQGTLQTSHLHLWTDMNVLAHGIPSSAGRKRGKKGPGYMVAGTAYSVPEFDVSLFRGSSDSAGKALTRDEADVAVSRAAREPWTAGHGTKVVRGEPLTFSLHVRWVEGGSAIGWPGRTAEDADGGGAVAAFVSKALFFALAASVGALVALYWERKRRTGWRGDGILGAPPRGKGSVGIVYGNGGRMNGYGGYSAASGATAGGGGYGLGFMNGKRD